MWNSLSKLVREKLGFFIVRRGKTGKSITETCKKAVTVQGLKEAKEAIQGNSRIEIVDKAILKERLIALSKEFLRAHQELEEILSKSSQVPQGFGDICDVCFLKTGKRIRSTFDFNPPDNLSILLKKLEAYPSNKSLFELILYKIAKQESTKERFYWLNKLSEIYPQNVKEIRSRVRFLKERADEANLFHFYPFPCLYRNVNCKWEKALFMNYLKKAGMQAQWVNLCPQRLGKLKNYWVPFDSKKASKEFTVFIREDKDVVRFTENWYSLNSDPDIFIEHEKVLIFCRGLPRHPSSLDVCGLQPLITIDELVKGSPWSDSKPIPSTRFIKVEGVLRITPDLVLFTDCNIPPVEDIKKVINSIVQNLETYKQQELKIYKNRIKGMGKEHYAYTSALARIGNDLNFLVFREYEPLFYGYGSQLDCVWLYPNGAVYAAIEVEFGDIKKDFISTWDTKPKVAIILTKTYNDDRILNLIYRPWFKLIPHAILMINVKTKNAFYFYRGKIIDQLKLKD